jgi:hypothetical protein
MTADSRKMMGFVSPGDSRVSITVRDWSALKLALWRSQEAWRIAARAAAEIVVRCAHVDDCPGKELESEQCLPNCPDREQRMSALVILGAARMFAPVDARRPASEPYFAPTREYFSERLAELAAAQAELEAWHTAYPAEVSPSVNQEPALTTIRAPILLPEAK